jgi:predicted PurR-regulated permease PerM
MRYAPALAVVLVAAILYVAKAVAVPLAVALLLTFLLSPAVGALERRRLRRVFAVALVVIVAFGTIGAAAWSIGGQLASLAEELPYYRGNIAAKIAEWKGAQGTSPFGRLQRLAEEVMGEIEKPAAGDAEPTRPPVPVVVQPPSLIWRLPSLVQAIASAGLVLVLVIFMLLRQRDLRNRIVRLFGYDRLALTTKALDEAGERITSYLVRQSAINGCFGVAVALACVLVGVPYAVLWGVLAGVLRFIPYAGAWVAGALPTLVAVAIFPGWWQPLAIVSAIGLLELMIYVAIEPWLYGRGAGVSEVALLAAVAFWTWLWGPIGLLLATPLTVCLVVLGKYVPSLRPVATLMSDEPVMPPGPLFYQRLVARDEHEAMGAARSYLAAHSLPATLDDLVVPALARSRADLEEGTLEPDHEEAIRQACRRIAYDLAQAGPLPASSALAIRGGAEQDGQEAVHVIGTPAHTVTDETALELLALLLGSSGYRVEIVSSGLLVSETLAAVAHARPAAVCLGSVGPRGLVHARYLVKRLALQDPDLPLVVGLWGLRRSSPLVRDRLVSAGVTHVGETLVEVAAHTTQIVQHAVLRNGVTRNGARHLAPTPDDDPHHAAPTAGPRD